MVQRWQVWGQGGVTTLSPDREARATSRHTALKVANVFCCPLDETAGCVLPSPPYRGLRLQSENEMSKITDNDSIVHKKQPELLLTLGMRPDCNVGTVRHVRSVVILVLLRALPRRMKLPLISLFRSLYLGPQKR